jgi:hypothetical protein
MPGVTFGGKNSFTSDQAWLAEELTANNLMPGGAILKTADFPIGTYPLNTATKRQEIVSGQLVGRTYAERTANAGFGPYATGDEEVYLTATVVNDIAVNPEVTLLRPNALIYEDKLPGWAALPAATKTVIRSKYICKTFA